MSQASKIRQRFNHALVSVMGQVLRLIAGRRAVDSRTIVFIRTDAIGDFVLFAPALKHLRSRFVGCNIVLVLPVHVTPLAEACPHVDDILAYDPVRFSAELSYQLSILVRLRNLTPAICVNTVYSSEVTGDLMVLWSGAKDRIGWKRSEVRGGTQRASEWIYTDWIQTDCTEMDPEVRKHKDLLRHLGAGTDAFSPVLWSSPDANIRAESLLQNAGVDRRSLIAVAPGAQQRYREWGATNFTTVMKYIASRDPLASIIIVGKAGEGGSFEIQGDATLQKRVADLRGLCGVGELPALFARCSLLIGNESAPVHIAIAMGTPTICVIGGGHYGRFIPEVDREKHQFVSKTMDCYFCNWHCIYPTTRCIEEIDSSMVTLAYDRFVGWMRKMKSNESSK